MHVPVKLNLLKFTEMFEMRNCNYVFPSEGGFAALAIDISNGVQSREQDTLLGWTATHIHPTGGK